MVACAQGVAAGDIDALLAQTRGAPLDAVVPARSESGAAMADFRARPAASGSTAHAQVGAWVEKRRQ